MDSERGKVIRVTVAGDQPKVKPGVSLSVSSARLLHPMQHSGGFALPGEPPRSCVIWWPSRGLVSGSVSPRFGCADPRALIVSATMLPLMQRG